jgi:hypothetical protein
MAKASIEDMIELVRRIDQQRGKHIKHTLSVLEGQNGGSLDRESRKAVLDGFNNYTRAIYLLLGYAVEK